MRYKEGTKKQKAQLHEASDGKECIWFTSDAASWANKGKLEIEEDMKSEEITLSSA